MICPSQSGLGVELIRAPVYTLRETWGYLGMPWKDLGGLVKNTRAMQILRISFESGSSCGLPNVAGDGCGADTR